MLKTYRGQNYELTGTRPYIRRDGTETHLAVWRSHCADCGEPFELQTPGKSSRFEPNRRCPKHKRPGCRVDTPSPLTVTTKRGTA
jgi:hypothetical protein